GRVVHEPAGGGRVDAAAGCGGRRDGAGVADGGGDRAGATALRMRNSLPSLRAERGWSQGDLAERLDVSRQTVNALERGKYDPSLPLAFRIARLFERTIEEIFQPD